MARIRIKTVPTSLLLQLRQLAFGGNLGTNGSNFTDGLTYFNVATRHEDNPNGGIPLGIAPDGQPNLVEGKDDPNKKDGGEIKWNKEEYIFSDRLKPRQQLIEKWKLPKAFLDYTYADAVRKSPIILEAEQRPNDPKSLDVMDKFLADVAQDLEEQKAEDKAALTLLEMNNMSPQQLADLNLSLELQELQKQELAAAELEAAMQELMALQLGLPSPEEMAAMLQQGGMPPQGMPLGMPQGMPPGGMPMMGANGGQLYANGGDLIAQGRDDEVLGAQPQGMPMPNMGMDPSMMGGMGMPPVEGEAAIPQEGMPEGETEVPEEGEPLFDFNKDAEDLSTNELNAVIEQILSYAENTGDRKLARKAKKIKTASRDKKEDFVNDALDDIKDKEDKAALEEENQRLQQPTPGDELAAQELGPAPEEMMPQEELMMAQSPDAVGGGNMFYDGGPLTDKQKQSMAELNLTEEDLDRVYWDEEDETWAPKREIDNIEVVAKAPVKRRPIIQGIINTLGISPMLQYITQNDVNPQLVHLAQLLKMIEDQNRRRDIRLQAQRQTLNIMDDMARRELLGQTSMSRDDLQNALEQLQFALGGLLGHTFEGGGHIIYVPGKLKFRYIRKNGTPSNAYYDTIKELLKAEEVPGTEWLDMYDAYNKLNEEKLWNKPVPYRGSFLTNADGTPSDKNKSTGYVYIDPQDNKSYKVYKNERGQLFAVDALTGKMNPQATTRLLDNPLKYMLHYYNTHNENTWVVKGNDGKPQTLYIDPDGNVRDANGEVDEYWSEVYKDPAQRLSFTYAELQAALTASAALNSQGAAGAGNTGAANGNGTASTGSTGTRTGTGAAGGAGRKRNTGIKGFTYAQDPNGDGYYEYDLGYRNFVENLTPELIAAIIDSDAWKNEQGNGKLTAYDAATLKDKAHGALDYHNGSKHSYAAALYKAHTAMNPSAGGDLGNGNGGEGDPQKKGTYVIQYLGADGKPVYSTPYDWTEGMAFDLAIGDIYDPTKHTLTLAENLSYGPNGSKVYTRADKTTPLDGVDENLLAFIRMNGEDPTKMDEATLNNWKLAYADATNPNNRKVKGLSTIGRYAPLLDFAEAPNGQPMVDLVLGTKNELKWMTAPRHGEYVKYQPVDSLYRINQLLSENNAARRGLINAANGNTGMLMANLALQNSKAQETMGKALMDVDTENWNRQKETIAQHNEVDKTWDTMALEADRANMSNNSIIASANRDAANLMWDAEQSRVAARNATRTNRLLAIANIGKENFAANLVNGNPALLYGYNPFTGSPFYKGLQMLTDELKLKLTGKTLPAATDEAAAVTGARGGCLTIKRKRRRK